MAFSLQNYQKFIESIILYEVDNWTPIDKICENLRKLIGDGLIPKSYLFPELSVESITKIVKDMDMGDADSILKNRKFIRSVILYEFLISENDKEKIYKKMLLRIGSEFIYCHTFSHWYCQFKNGNYDFYDKSLDSVSSTFSDLPIDVIRIVVEKLDLKEQLTLRNVSRNLRSLFDKQKPAYKTIKLDIKRNHVEVKFNDETVIYCDTGFNVADHYYFCVLKNLKILESSDYIDTAFNDVAIALKNPKLRLETLKFVYRSSSYVPEIISGYKNAAKVCEMIRNLLKTLNHKISVRELLMKARNQEQLFSILPYLKPKVLKTISICDEYNWTNLNYHIDQIALLDQWKYAKDVKIYALIPSSPEYFLHFNRFVINIHSITIDDLVHIRDKLLTSTEFQYCSISSLHVPSFSEIERIFRISLRVPENTRKAAIHHWPIPNSNEFFKFVVSTESFSIERMSHCNTTNF